MSNAKKIKAIALLSGGLDSALAVKVILEQDIEVVGIKFTSPFCNCDQKGHCFSKEIAAGPGIEFRMESKGAEYLEVVKNPRFGRGSGINPCIDCRIYMLKKTKVIAAEINADFIITGDVLAQRPMSQHRTALETIEKESELDGLILRPLSAGLLPETIPEKKGWVNREKLLAISGRSRKTQLDMAVEKNINSFACAAGGCLLTDKNFARKMRDLFDNQEGVSISDILLLKIGRHFRFNGNKIIVGRNESENSSMLSRKKAGDYIFQLPDIPGPTTILQGEKNKEAIELAAGITLKYSDSNDKTAQVIYGENEFDHEILASSQTADNLSYYNIASGE